MPQRISRPQLIMIVAFVVAALYFGFRVLSSRSDGKLRASGTIETVEVDVSPETAGLVKEVLAEEGQPVKQGDPLLVLDGSLLAAQRDVAQRGVESARNAQATAQSAYALAEAQYQATVTTARAEEGAGRLVDWSKRTPNYFEQPLWYFDRSEQIASAQKEVDASQQALQQALTDMEKVVNNLNNADYVAAETRLSDARTSYLVAHALRDHARMTGGKVSPEDLALYFPPDKIPDFYRARIAIAHDLSGDSQIVSAANDVFDGAETELHEAEKAYKNLLTTEAAQHVQEARAKVAVAQERHDVALDTLSQLQIGEYSPQVNISAKALEQAKTALTQAESAVQQAESNLALLDQQIAKLTIYAPMDGIVLTRNAEPGEFVQPGASAITMANLDELTMTVYVPEDRYGEISLGQKAIVNVDSFPNETFTATVSFIADQAEFTPRNVQTVEGRSATVYAVKLKVNDPSRKLKLGMPADVVFTK